jgi:uncharacterized protein YraI
MKDSSVHISIIICFVSDDDCRRISYLMNIYAMRQFWFKTLLGVLTLVCLGAGVFLVPQQAEAYQGASTPTGVFVTVIYDGPVNVRSGPSTVDFPVPIGQLQPGEMVPALGVTARGDWVQISFSGGTGWVYASFVSISGGELLVVESPPTPVKATVTTDPTLAAAFTVQPTQTRMPTFTPPPPLTVPQFPEENSAGSSGGVVGFFILGLGLIGSLGLLVSFVLRK